MLYNCSCRWRHFQVPDGKVSEGVAKIAVVRLRFKGSVRVAVRVSDHASLPRVLLPPPPHTLGVPLTDIVSLQGVMGSAG